MRIHARVAGNPEGEGNPREVSGMEVRRNERLGLLDVWVPRSERGLEETQQ